MPVRHAFLAALLTAVLLAAPAAGEQVTFDAKDLLERAVTDGLRLAGDGSALELDRGALIEDDGPAAGYSYKPCEERLGPGVQARKELLLDDACAARATLLVAGSGTLGFIVNGRSLALRSQGKVGGHWEAYDLPVDALRAGRNEIVVQGEGRLWIARADEFAAGSIDRPRHPNRSARSADVGRTWDRDRLGPDGSIDGEYCVRLFLDRHRSMGSVVLPALDVGNLGGRPAGDPLRSDGPLHVRIDVDEAGDAGRVTTWLRSNSTVGPDRAWGPWRKVNDEDPVHPGGRYVQLAIDLATTDPLRSPKLRRVTVEASPRPKSDWARSLRLVESVNPRIVRTAIPFEYEPFDHPRLKLLREQHRLDDVVREAATEFDLILRLAQWSASRWPGKGHLGEGYPPWDALEILRPHRDGTPVGGFCQQFNLVFLQACESFGIPGRAVSLGPGGLIDKPRRGGHEVVEVWSNDHGKWVYVDGEFAWYAADEKTGVPLSLWELRRRQLDVLAGRPAEPVGIVKPGDVPRRGQEDWHGLDRGIPFGELRMIPRSNFLQRAAPLPLNQGMRGWSWTGHHVWTDEALPAAPIYGHRVVARGNWEWTLNQAHIVLEATATPGELLVHVDTETPGFETFLVGTGTPRLWPMERPFIWRLTKGRNVIEVRPRNVAGRVGIPSRLVLEYP